jgi:acetyl esterase
LATTLRMHPEMQPLLDARAEVDRLVGPRGDDHLHAREGWNAYARVLAEPPPADLAVHDRAVPVAGRGVPVRVYEPARVAAPRPCVVYMHGGWFSLGDLDSSDANAWGFAAQCGATVVSVDYRLTPEHPYPAAFDDCYGVLAWLAENPDELGIDPDRIAVAGDSAGGLLSAALSLAARDRGGPRIAAQALVYTTVGCTLDLPSFAEFAEGYGHTTATIPKYWRRLLPDDEDTADPYARPIMATDFSGLPPALVHQAELDPIRDEGRAYAAKLALAGTDVTYREARGMIHGFMRVRFTGPDARREYGVVCDFLRHHLSS